MKNYNPRKIKKGGGAAQRDLAVSLSKWKGSLEIGKLEYVWLCGWGPPSWQNVSMISVNAMEDIRVMFS